MVPGVGGGELILIAVVALVVVGPKDLPKLLRQLGRYVGKMRRMADDFRTSFDDMARQSELDDLRKEVEALRTGKVQAIEDINAEVNAIGSDIQTSLKSETPSYTGNHEMMPLNAADLTPDTAVIEGYDDQMAGLPPKEKPVGDAPSAAKPKRVRKPVVKTRADVTPTEKPIKAPVKSSPAKKIAATKRAASKREAT